MKARIKFSKTGSMKFVGHLDLMRYFQKVFRRGEIDIAYSQGFNHHQLMSFAQPLGVGITSDGEYLDVQLNRLYESEDMIKIINSQLNEEVRIKDFLVLEEKARNAMSIVSAADYRISLKETYLPIKNFKDKFENFLTQDTIMIEKKTKKSTALIDLKPFLYQASHDKKKFMQQIGADYTQSVALIDNTAQEVYLRIATGSVTNIKPELVMNAFYVYAKEICEPYSLQYHRYDLFANQEGGQEQPDFVSLGVIKQ